LCGEDPGAEAGPRPPHEPLSQVSDVPGLCAQPGNGVQGQRILQAYFRVRPRVQDSAGQAAAAAREARQPSRAPQDAWQDDH